MFSLDSKLVRTSVITTILGVATIASGPTFARAATTFDAAMMSAMTQMDGAMAAAPMTGDPDRDFIAMMVPHHRGAVAMAELELASGHDPRLRRLAQEIVVTQGSEIDVMRAIARDLTSSPMKVKK